MGFIISNRQVVTSPLKLYILQRFFSVCFTNASVIHFFQQWSIFLEFLLCLQIYLHPILFVLEQKKKKKRKTCTIFSNSISIAKDLFDLIHCDTWDPYKHPTSCSSFIFLLLLMIFRVLCCFTYFLRNMKCLNSLNIFMPSLKNIIWEIHKNSLFWKLEGNFMLKAFLS